MNLRSGIKTARSASSKNISHVTWSDDIGKDDLRYDDCHSTASDFIYYSNHRADLSKVKRSPDTPTMKVALDPNGTHYQQWVAATRKEILEGLLGGDIPCLTPTKKSDVGKNGKQYKIFRSAVRFTIKRNSANPTVIEKFKCRATCDSSVLKGTYKDTFSPTISALSFL